MPLNRTTPAPATQNAEKLVNTLEILRAFGADNVHAQTVHDERFGTVVTKLIKQKDASEENRAVIGKHIADLLIAIKQERTGAHAKIFEAPNFGVAMHYLSAVTVNAPKECLVESADSKPLTLGDSLLINNQGQVHVPQTSEFMGPEEYDGLPSQIYEHIAPEGRKLETFVRIPTNNRNSIIKRSGLTAFYSHIIDGLPGVRPNYKGTSELNCFYLATNPLESKAQNLPTGDFYRIVDGPRGRIVEGWNNPTQTSEQRKRGVATYTKMGCDFTIEHEFSVNSMLSLPDNLIARAPGGQHIVFVAGRVLQNSVKTKDIGGVSIKVADEQKGGRPNSGVETFGWARAAFDIDGKQIAQWEGCLSPYQFIPEGDDKPKRHIQFKDGTAQAQDLSPAAQFAAKVDTPEKAQAVLEGAAGAMEQAINDTQKLQIEIDEALRNYSAIAYSSTRLHSKEKTVAYDTLRNACAAFESATLSIKSNIELTKIANEYLHGQADIEVAKRAKEAYPELSKATKKYNKLLEDVFYLNPITVDGKKVSKKGSLAVPTARQVVLRPPVFAKKLAPEPVATPVPAPAAPTSPTPAPIPEPVVVTPAAPKEVTMQSAVESLPPLTIAVKPKAMALPSIAGSTDGSQITLTFGPKTARMMKSNKAVPFSTNKKGE